jgi:hypothetical protein
MTVAVSCNLSDGVALAVDSAVTLPDASGGVIKVYENAQKLFQLGDRPIGIAVFGLGALGSRSIGSYLREFETLDPNGVVSGRTSLQDLVEALRDFLLTSYMAQVAPVLERQHGTRFDELAPTQIPVLGVVVGGFSDGAFQSEVWEISVPLHSTTDSATCWRQQGDFGTNWFAMFGPIARYMKGYDPELLGEVIDYVVSARGGLLLDPQESAHLQGILNSHEYQIPFALMPIEEGIEHTRFLAELVVSHHRYAVGAPVVGGRVKVGSVTYRGGRFQIHADRP